MQTHIAEMKAFFIEQKLHHEYRQNPISSPYQLAEGFSKSGLSDFRRAHERLKWVLEHEEPIVFEKERIAIIRTVPVLPELYTQSEWDTLENEHYRHEQGKVCNIAPLYEDLIKLGTEGKRKVIEAQKALLPVEEQGYLEVLKETLTLIDRFSKRYRQAALAVGNQTVAETFAKIPQKGADSFLEALQFFRLLHFCLWGSYNYHNTIGRFDQYLYPYWKKDMETGRMTSESASELLAEFFISFNKDSDLYPGMQQGDNGQSMVLGGKNIEGGDDYNELSTACLMASLDLKLIDPKINLRVHAQTSLEVYELGSELTRQGLGFPQYSNDDLVIPALINWGYEPEDAYNYVVAACWEFIIPGVGMDIPNIGGLSFAEIVRDSLNTLPVVVGMEEIEDRVHQGIRKRIQTMSGQYRNVYMEPSPLLSLLMKGCVESGRDVSQGLKYNNYGIHGTGLSTAVDSLAAVKTYVFERAEITGANLFELLERNYEDDDGWLVKLRDEAPKFGNNDALTNEYANTLLGWFADAVDEAKNDRGGCYRAGTGSAMYYIWHSNHLGATPDGRKAGEPFACNYSPSLHSRCDGPLSIIQSFATPDLKRVANGGPLTIELGNQMFRSHESTRKVAQFVRAFMELGGHQIQINAVNREDLLDAQKNPQNHRNLIVRVWGWSGYFVELDEVYQNHIIKRTEITIQ